MADDELRKLFRKHLRGFDLQAIETGATGGGVPDLNYAKNHIEGWCEMKKADHWRATIRPAQVGWAERRLRHGGRVFCAVRRAHDELWLFHGSLLRALTTTRVDALPNLGHWSGGPAAWNWEQVEQILLYR
jgi:hypothetical protein